MIHSLLDLKKISNKIFFFIFISCISHTYAQDLNQIYHIPINGNYHMYKSVFSNDGVLIATRRSSKIWLWNIDNNENILRFENHENIVTALNFSNDDKYMISADLDAKVKIWEVDSGNLLHELDLNTYHAGIPDHPIVTECLFLPDTGSFLTATTTQNDAQVKIWNLKTGVLKHKIDAGGKIDFTSDGLFYLVGNRLYRCSDNTLIRTFQDDGSSISVDGQNVLSINTGKIWNLNNGNFVNELNFPQGIVSDYTSDWRYFAINDNKSINIHKRMTNNFFKNVYTFKVNNNDIYSASFSPKNDKIAIHLFDKTILYDISKLTAKDQNATELK